MFPPTVTGLSGRVYKCKNLHWLIKRRKQVLHIYAYTGGGLKAVMKNGSIYRVSFADKSIMHEFIVTRWHADMVTFSDLQYESHEEVSDES